jgi:site-specific recombinase XerD
MVVRGFAEATRESYESAMVGLIRAHGGVAPDQLNGAQVQTHLARMIGEWGRSWSTVNVHMSAFRCFYRDVLGRSAYAFTLPPRGRSRRLPTILDRASVAAILEAAADLRARAILAMVYGSGLRVSEVCRLRPCHIESAPDRMLVRVEQGKGHKDRHTLLGQKALEVLREYWRAYRPAGEWIFPGREGGRPISEYTAQRAYYEACRLAGIPQERAHGIHTLRHCFASHLMENGTALPVIQKLLGHGSLSTTSVYCHVSRALLGETRSPGDALKRAGGCAPRGGRR